MKNVIYTVVAAALITNVVGAVFCVIGNCVPYDIKTLSYTMLHWSIVTHA